MALPATAARRRRHALPALRRPLPLRRRLPRPPRPLPLRPLRPHAPQPQVSARDIVLEGGRGAALHAVHAGGRPPDPLPLRGLYNVYNALAAAALALALGAAPDARRRRPARRLAPPSGARRRFAGRRPRASILLVQEPGRRQPGAAHAAARRPASTTLCSSLNDGIADGRDVSWVWDADFEVLAGARATRRRAAARGPPRWRCGSSTPACPPSRIAVEPDLGDGLDRALAASGDGRLLRAADLHGDAGAARPARRARRGRRRLVHMTHDVVWHDVECGAYDLDLPLWRELAEREGSPVLDVGAGTGRVALDLARRGHEVVALDRDPGAAGALRARAGGPARHHRDGRRAATFDLGRRFALVVAPMQTLQLLGGPDGRARFLARVREHLAPGGLVAALADALEAFDEEHDQPPVPDMSDVDGLVYASRPVAVRDLGDRAAIDRVREIVALDGTRTVSDDVIELDRVTPDELDRRRPRRSACAPSAAALPQTLEYVGSTVVDAPWLSGALRVCALYPDLMNIYADRGNLLLLERRCAVARHRLRGRRRRPRRGRSTPIAHDLFYIGGGQDRDQALCAQDMVDTKRDALHAAADARPRRARRVRRLPAARPPLRARRRADPRGRARRPAHRARGRPATDRQRRHRGPPAGARGTRVLAGFENHGGRTHLGAGEQPLGRVLKGHGNNGASGFEGVPRDHVIGTYLHGPLLPKNAWFADWLIATALGLDEPLRRSRTRWSAPRTPMRGAWRASRTARPRRPRTRSLGRRAPRRRRSALRRSRRSAARHGRAGTRPPRARRGPRRRRRARRDRERRCGGSPRAPTAPAPARSARPPRRARP